MVLRLLCIKKMKSHKLVTAVVVLIIVLGKNVIYTVLDQKHFSGSDRPVKIIKKKTKKKPVYFLLTFLTYSTSFQALRPLLTHSGIVV